MSSTEETLDIETPENVAFGYQVAGIGSRFLATLVDTLIIVFLQIVILLVRALVLYMLDDTTGGKASPWVIALFGLIAFVFYSGYYVLFEMLWNGQSPGKRWAGIRVIRRDGTPVTLSESLVRNLARLVDFLPVAYGIGIISMFLDQQSRRLGDLAAGTLVVHDRVPISLQSLRRSSSIKAQGFSNISLDGFPIERLTNDDVILIEDFLSRRDQMTHRESLAIQILNTLHTRRGLPLPAISRRLEAEDILVAILQASQKQTEEK